MKTLISLLYACFLIIAMGGSTDALTGPKFVGKVTVEWCSAKDKNCCLDDLEENVPRRKQHNCNRDMKLLKPFSFVDKEGRKWTAPAGFVIDGATIPKPLWVPFGSPYVGKYRRASVVHDYYCVRQNRSLATKKQVHRMFYEAMLCDGVAKQKAWLMWKGVELGWVFTKWN